MSRQGYDDTDSIERVAALMRSEPGLARQAAIKRVVGTNRSNIRRIETKMQRAAAKAAAPSAQPHPVSDDRGMWSETLLLTATLVLFALPLGLWLAAPGTLVYPVLGAYWLKLKFAVLVAGPLDAIGSGALATIESHLARGDIGSIDSKLLSALNQDVTSACRNVVAAALAVTVVWAACSLRSIPRDKVAPPRTFSVVRLSG